MLCGTHFLLKISWSLCKIDLYWARWELKAIFWFDGPWFLISSPIVLFLTEQELSNCSEGFLTMSAVQWWLHLKFGLIAVIIWRGVITQSQCLCCQNPLRRSNLQTQDTMVLLWYYEDILLECNNVNDCEHQRLDQLCRAFCAFVARAIIALSSNRQFPQIFQSSGKSSAMWEDSGWQV